MSPSDVPPPFDDGPCDPDRSYAYRDSGGGDEDADDAEPPIGPVDTDYSYALAKARYPRLVTPKDYPRSGQVPGALTRGKEVIAETGSDP